MGIWGHLGTSLGGVWEGLFWVDSGSFWVDSGVNLGPLSEKPHETRRIAFIWPWVGPLASDILNIGSWDGWVGVPV